MLIIFSFLMSNMNFEIIIDHQLRDLFCKSKITDYKKRILMFGNFFTPRASQAMFVL